MRRNQRDRQSFLLRSLSWEAFRKLIFICRISLPKIRGAEIGRNQGDLGNKKEHTEEGRDRLTQLLNATDTRDAM